MKGFGIIIPVLSLMAAQALARDCPLESDCFQKSCKNIQLLMEPIPFVDNSVYRGLWRLHAECRDNAGIKTVTRIDLSECIGNFDGNLLWSKHGGLYCDECKLTKTDPVIMQCECKTKKQKLVVREINLSEGIWVYDGAIGCYDTQWVKFPGIGKY
ncbi:Putative cyanovirin-N [Colletotrichum destructivum]|uniref:Cyanovirin-N n=1 Tax=Colletotrichum destructivum TaxID=34406 RepID=A0AAX4ISL9_9PEZI|nr:Putative cyanovirin-N [Colletotrichum destructivum]